MPKLLPFLLALCAGSALAAVEQFKLDNGLRVIVKEDHRAPVAVSMVWYNVGSADEPAGITGVSHALEHLMFKGTTRYPLGVFSKTVASIGGEENAFTNNDYTAYYEKIAAKNLPLMLELEADRMKNLRLDPQEFSREIRVIQEERRMRTDDNPKALAFERFMAAAHLSAPYHSPVIGWMSDLEHMRVEDARNWYDRYYAPNNATLVVVGDVNPQNVKALAQKYFGHLKPSSLPERKAVFEPPALGKKTVQISAPAQLPMVMLGYSVPGVTTAKNPEDAYVLEVIAGILDGGESARFQRELVRKERIAASASAWYNLYARYTTQFIVFGTPAAGHTSRELANALQQSLDALKTEKVSEKELQRVKNQIIAQKTFEKDSLFGQAMEIGLLETVGLGQQTGADYVKRIRAVTPENIQDVAKRYFRAQSLTEAELFPEPQNGAS